MKRTDLELAERRIQKTITEAWTDAKSVARNLESVATIIRKQISQRELPSTKNLQLLASLVVGLQATALHWENLRTIHEASWEDRPRT